MPYHKTANKVGKIGENQYQFHKNLQDWQETSASSVKYLP